MVEVFTVTTGFETTVTVVVSESKHPFASVPVTVYEVVTVGLAVTGLPLELLKPVPGVHVYVAAPLAVNVVEAPLQINPLLTVTVGKGFTTTVVVAKFAQPFPSTPPTV